MKKNIWILLTLLLAASIGFIYKYFDQAMPFVRVAITMDANEARVKSRALAELYGWDVAGYDEVATFQNNNKLQAFVELEGGGKKAFIDMIEEGYHQPYNWVVRFYKPAEIKEFFVAFTPDGTPYEFSMKTPESQEGPSLHKDQALKIATQGAQAWNVPLSAYDFVEYHNETQPSGRVDHVFVYQRHDVTLKDGLYRLKLKVCGDTFACLDRHVKIPNEFDRRYAQMFATNRLIASVAFNVAVFLYIFIIGLFACLFFYRNRRYLLIRSHSYLAMAFGTIMLLSSLNMLPLWWNCYQTHNSVFLFMMSQLGITCLGIGFFSLVVGFVCTITDASDRYVFGRHIQFLKNWSPGVAGSHEILQQTLLGYVSAIIFMGYETGYALLTQRLGWWSPLSTLVDPNILSGYIPAISPAVLAFRAGFFEEFVFRGLPLAGIALMTRNSKKKACWFWGMFVVQAIIFGAMHANYPQLPAYNRIVELMVPSFWFGALYYWFGLLPGIVMHFVYDALLMCIPIWISDLWLQKILCSLLIFIPLLVVIFYWYRQKRKLVHAPASAYNSDIAHSDAPEQEGAYRRAAGQALHKNHKIMLIVFGWCGLMMLYVSNQWNFPTPPLKITSVDAKRIAQSKMEDLNIELAGDWTITQDYVNPTKQMGNEFIWQKYGQAVYEKLQDSYVAAPHWLISWKNFTGPVEDRAEEVKFMIDGSGVVRGVRHIIPEYRAGADLSEKEALRIADELIQDWFETPKDHMQLVFCESKKHAQRRDWSIKYKDIVGYDLDHGQGHIIVKLAGDQLAEIQRDVQAPEEWQREERNRQVQEAVLKTILFLLMALLVFMATCIGFAYYRRFDKLLIPVGVVTLCLVLVYFATFFNAWNQILNYLSTSEPLGHQIISMVMSSIVGYIGMSFVFALLITLMVLFGSRAADRKSITTYVSLIVAGMGFAGLEMFLSGFAIFNVAPTMYTEYINYLYPSIAILTVYYCNAILVNAVLIMSLCTIASYLEKKHVLWTIVLFAAVGIMSVDCVSLLNVPLWLGAGLVTGFIWFMLYRLVLVHNIEALGFILTGMLMAKFIPSVFCEAYPGVLLSFVVGTVLFLLCLIGLYRKI